MNKERWKIIKGFDNYFVSSAGKVASFHKKKIHTLSSSDNGNGYLRLYLYKNKKRYKFFVHRIVADAFHTNPDPSIYTQVHHKDHDRTNNASTNVMWATPKLNCYYRDQFNKGKQKP